MIKNILMLVWAVNIFYPQIISEFYFVYFVLELISGVSHPAAWGRCEMNWELTVEEMKRLLTRESLKVHSVSPFDSHQHSGQFSRACKTAP